MYPRYYTENGDNIKFEFSEDESHWALAYDPELQWLKPKRRPIAGSKRVARYQMEQDQIHSGVRQVLQSITAHPDLSTRSFEVCSNFFHYYLSLFSISSYLLGDEYDSFSSPLPSPRFLRSLGCSVMPSHLSFKGNPLHLSMLRRHPRQ